MNKNKNKPKRKFSITYSFSLTICIIMIITALLTHLGFWLLNHFDILESDNYLPLFLFFEIITTIVGTLAAIYISKHLIKPIYSIIQATEQITTGDYSARLHLNSCYEFDELSQKFNSMAKELNSVEMLRNDFINQFSHEFNTPINSIQGFANALKNENLSKEEKEKYLDNIITGTDRLSNLAINVLNLAKIEQQEILTNKTRINVTEQIRRVIAMLSFRWEKKEIDFDFDCDECFIVGNAELLEHVWSNILDNAIKYSPPYSKIYITITETPSHVTVILRDFGKGIAEESLPHVFEKFYRSKSSSTTPGTGLGLTIAHKVVTLHKGTIKVSSVVKEGTTFTVTLPKNKG